MKTTRHSTTIDCLEGIVVKNKTTRYTQTGKICALDEGGGGEKTTTGRRGDEDTMCASKKKKRILICFPRLGCRPS